MVLVLMAVFTFAVTVAALLVLPYQRRFARQRDRIAFLFSTITATITY